MLEIQARLTPKTPTSRGDSLEISLPSPIFTFPFVTFPCGMGWVNTLGVASTSLHPFEKSRGNGLASDGRRRKRRRPCSDR